MVVLENGALRFEIDAGDTFLCEGEMVAVIVHLLHDKVEGREFAVGIDIGEFCRRIVFDVVVAVFVAHADAAAVGQARAVRQPALIGGIRTGTDIRFVVAIDIGKTNRGVVRNVIPALFVTEGVEDNVFGRNVRFGEDALQAL